MCCFFRWRESSLFHELSVGSPQADERGRGGVRSLPVPQQALLLLQLLDLLLVGRLGDELVDVGEVPLGGDLEAGILLADAVAPPRHLGL